MEGGVQKKSCLESGRNSSIYYRKVVNLKWFHTNGYFYQNNCENYISYCTRVYQNVFFLFIYQTGKEFLLYADVKCQARTLFAVVHLVFLSNTRLPEVLQNPSSVPLLRNVLHLAVTTRFPLVYIGCCQKSATISSPAWWLVFEGTETGCFGRRCWHYVATLEFGVFLRGNPYPKAVSGEIYDQILDTGTMQHAIYNSFSFSEVFLENSVE